VYQLLNKCLWVVEQAACGNKDILLLPRHNTGIAHYAEALHEPKEVLQVHASTCAAKGAHTPNWAHALLDIIPQVQDLAARQLLQSIGGCPQLRLKLPLLRLHES